jgi:hypothetical protein
MTEQRERIHGYLTGQAERYDFIDLWPRVMAQRAAFLQALEGVSDEQGEWEPGAGEGEEAWGILQVAQHVLRSTQNVMAIVEATARGEAAPKDPPGIRDGAPATLPEVRRALVEQSEEFATLRRRLPDQPNLDATVDHAFFGPLNSRAWFLFQRIHDADHTRQVETLKASEGFPS